MNLYYVYEQRLKSHVFAYEYPPSKAESDVSGLVRVKGKGLR